MIIDIAEITREALAGVVCSKTVALELACNADLGELINSSNQIRQKFFGNKVKLCMIINAKSGVCDMDCRFCSQSGHYAAEPPVYPFMLASELAENIYDADANGTHSCGVVTSGGRLTSEDVDIFADSLKQTNGKVKCEICASLGRLTMEDMGRLKAAGLNRYHHNLETSEKFYPEICSTQEWAERFKTVQAAKQAGLEVCSGGLFGLGESWEDRIDLALALSRLGVDSVPINFLIPHLGTPLGDTELLSADEALRIIAVYRHILPTKTLRICGGRGVVLKDKQNQIFAAGANAIMTGDYLTTKGQMPTSDKEMIQELGLEILQG
ncbi:MAG: biotin synthase BioB [Phycisphaerae bacterium]|nr:biotin synthase BioB [Phycisphaerae bacterium]